MAEHDHTEQQLARDLTILNDQWLEVAAQSAFTCESLIRLLKDHKDLTEEVIEGAEKQCQLLRHSMSSFGGMLLVVHEVAAKQ